MTSVDIDHLKEWTGKIQYQADDIGLFPTQALAAALDNEQLPEKGDVLPVFWEWLYFLATPRASATGTDGHPSKGGFLPPVPLPRRMWAAGQAQRHRPVIIGQPAERVSTIKTVDLKEGSTGVLVFVTVEHDIKQQGELCIRQQQDIVYREAPARNAPLPPVKSPPENPDWQQTVTPDPVMLFRYSALTYNGHRIHYDRTYATGEEFYPALVVHGPLLVTLLFELQRQQAPELVIKGFKFRAVRPTFDSHPFQVQGKLNGDQLQLWSVDKDNALCMQIDAELSSSLDE
jgi:3-methylfumaryl-CoA hydratase